jgi:hypothetical protein
MQLIVEGTESPARLEAISAFVMYMARQNAGQAPDPASIGSAAAQETGDAGDGAGASAAAGEQPAGTKRRGRPKTDKTPETPPQQTATNSGNGPSKEDVKAAVQAVIEVEKLGMDAAMKIVEGFKNADGGPCQTLKELQATDYAAVIDACKKAVAGAGKASASLMDD